MKRFRILSIILAAVLIALSAGVQAVEWTRYAMEGGVVNDIAFVTYSNPPSSYPMVLSVCMANGLFYKNYNNGWPDLWNEELPGKVCYGVDAVYYDGEILALCSTEGKKVRWGTYSSGSGWDWNFYDWDITLNLAGVQYPGHYEDAAFCCVNGLYSFDYAFCILNDYEGAGSANDRSGIYFWDYDNNEWELSYEVPSDSGFSHFYRDKENPDSLYAIGTKGIFLFDGDDYGTGNWADITDDFIDLQSYTVNSIVGFYQDASTYTRYILAIVTDVNGTTYQVFNDDATPIGGELESETDEPVGNPLSSQYNYRDLILKDLGAGGYEIWVASNKFGPLKYQNNSWSQLQNLSDTDLTTWHVRCMVEDPVPATDSVEIFYGAWQGGIFYSDDEGANWSKMNTGLTGGACGASVGGGLYYDDTLYGNTYQSGLFQYESGTWGAIGEGNASVQERAHYCKSFNFLKNGPNDYLFATARPYFKHEFAGDDTCVSGGLYYLDLSSDSILIAFGWDDDNSIGDTLWDGFRLAYGNNSIYVSTGEVGYNTVNFSGQAGQNKQIISRGFISGSLTWERIGEYDERNDLGILALHPYLSAYPNKVIYGLGNRWDYATEGGTSVAGEIYGPNPSNPTGDSIRIDDGDIYSVFDIDVSLDSVNNYTVYAATARWSAPGKSQGMYEAGKLKKYTVTSGDVVDTTFTLSPATQDHGVMSVRLFDLSNWHLVFCLTKGYTGTGIDMQTEIHLLGYRITDPVHPRDFGVLQIANDENLQAPENIIDIYLDAGAVHFLVGGGSDIFKYSQTVHTDEFEDGVNWYSVNYQFPFDSIAFILSNLDSLEVAVNQWGYRYIPGTVDSIYIWDPLECYKIRVSDDDAFEAFYENKIPTDTNIVLIDDDTLNWNYIAYLPDDSIRCDTVFADVGNFVMVKNDDGGFWGNEGGAPFYMRPGEGYQVKVSVRDTLNYPISQGGESVNPFPFGDKNYSQGKTNSLLPTHFVFTNKTGDFYPMVIEQIMVNGENPEYGDEIGIFTPEDICVGAVKYEGEFPLNFPAWKDDPWTAETDGYLPNQQMVFKFWDASAEVEIPLTLLLIIPENIEIKEGNKGLTSLPSAEFFEENDYFRGSLEGNYLLPLEFSLSQNYPNPFNPSTSIRYTIKWRSQVKISIFNILGQKVVNLVDDFQDTGQYRIVWDGTNKAGVDISSGIYFLKMSAKSTEEHFGKYESFHKSLKMLMLK